MTKPLLCLVLAALCGSAPALGANWAVGARPGGIAELRAQLPASTTLVPGSALLVRGDRPRVHGAAYVVDLDRSQPRRAAMDAMTDRIMREIAALTEPRHRGRYGGSDTV